MTVPAEAAQFTRIDLARDARTTLVLPAAFVLLGVAVAAGSAALLGWPAMLIGVAIGLALLGAGAWIGLRTRSLQLAVETDYLHLTGLRVDRRYHLARGGLSRVSTAGPTGVRLRTRPSTLGLGMGRSSLGGDEQIEVIRLGATPSVIVVPTEKGRLAVAAASEDALVRALMAAAKTRAERPPAPAAAPALAAAPAPAVAPLLPLSPRWLLLRPLPRLRLRCERGPAPPSAAAAPPPVVARSPLRRGPWNRRPHHAP